MPNNARIGGAYFIFTADSRGYDAGVNRAIAANQRFGRSITGVSRGLIATQAGLDRFAASVRTSLLATTAYVAGVGAVTAALRGTVGGFLDYDQALIRVGKTTGIAGDELERLGQRIEGLAVNRLEGFGLLREDLFSIAAAAGQAGIQTTEGIATITRAAAALQSSSDLIGGDAVRALTRYLQVTNQGVERTDAIASAITELGNNIVGTESGISRFAVRVAQNLSAVGHASDAFILGISATLLEAGVEMEAAGSALQRAQIALVRQAANPAAFNQLGDAIGGTAEEVDALRNRFLDGEATAADYDRALRALLVTYRNLQPGQRQPFLADFIGGGEANVRNTRVLAALSNRMERLDRNTRLASRAVEEQSAHFEEAGRAAEAWRVRLQVVGQELLAQATTAGGAFVPALVTVAENFRVLELAAVGLGVALAGGFTARRLRSMRDATLEIRRQAEATRAAAAAEALRTRQVATGRAQQVNALRASRLADPATVSVATITQATRRYERDARRATAAARELVSANRAVSQTTRTLGQRLSRLGSGILGFVGGPWGALLTAISLGATAWALWGNRTTEAEDRMASLRDEVEQSIRAISGEGLTQEGNLAQRVAREVEEAEARLALAQQRLVESRTGIGGLIPFLDGGAEEEYEEARRLFLEAVELQARFQRETGLSSQSVQDFTAAAEESFQRLPASILPATQAIERFQSQLDRAQSRTLARGQLQLENLGLSELRQEQSLAVFDAQNDLLDRQAQAAEQVRQARERVLETERRIGTLQERQGSLTLGSEAQRQTTQALQQAERQLERDEDALRLRERERELLNGILVDQTRITAAVRDRFELEDRQRLAAVRVREPADILGAERAAEDELQRLRDRLRQARVTAAAVNTAGNDRELAAFRARLEVTQRYEERLRNLGRFEERARGDLENRERALRELVDAQERALDTGRDLSELDHRRREQLQSEVNSLRTRVVELDAESAALQAQRADYEALAEASAAFAAAQVEQRSAFQGFAEDAENLRERLQQVAARGFDSLADSLAALATRGKANFSDLANSIIQDLLRVLARAKVIAPLIQSLSSFFPGFFGGGGVNTIGNPAFAAGFHTGGVAPHAPQRLRRSAGLRGDEMMAVLQRGEIVIPRNLSRRARYGGAQDMAALMAWIRRLPRFHEGGVAGGGSFGGGFGGATKIELINETGRPMRLEDGGVNVSAGDVVQRYMIRDVASNGPVTRALGANFGLRQR